MMETQVASKSPQVKSWFENPNQYLQRRNFDIRIRLETVQGFTKGATFGRVLDIPCGDGSISLPLLPRSQEGHFARRVVEHVRHRAHQHSGRSC